MVTAGPTFEAITRSALPNAGASRLGATRVTLSGEPALSGVL